MRFYSFIVKNILRRKVRSLLTGVGVAIGITAVVSLLGVTSGFKQSMVETYSTHGVDLIVERAGAGEIGNGSLKEAIAGQISRVDGVAAVTPTLREMSNIGEEALGVPVHGWPVGGAMFDNLQIVEGRKLAEGDEDQVMLGSILASNLDKKVGDTVDIEPRQFKVVGIFKSPSRFEDAAAILPLPTLQDMVGRPGMVSEFQVALKGEKGDQSSTVSEVKRQIGALHDDQSQKLGLQAKETAEAVASNTEIRLAGALAWVISVIALMIGSVGVLNTMVMSVLERTQEIGILRAIGWRRSRIVRMILLESFAISLAGAVLGAMVAVVMIRALSQSAIVQGYLRADISPSIIGLGFLLSLGVGLIGGAYPAYRGASLPPTEALRYE